MRARLWFALLAAFASLAAPRAQTTTPPTAAPGEMPNAGPLIRLDIHPTLDGHAVTDLTAADITLTEDGVAQKLEHFEPIIDPSRSFVVFLDTAHMRFEGARDVRIPLVRFLDRLLDDDDVVGLMTPDMTPADIQFGVKSATLSAIMDDEAAWERVRLGTRDPREDRYAQCFPANQYRDVASEMQERHRERLTFDALDRLMSFLATSRERRTAVITLTDGWRLFGPTSRLGSTASTNRPGGGFGGFGGIGGRRGGFPGQGGRGGRSGQGSGGTGADDGDGGRDVDSVSRTECENDRAVLAALDDSRRLDRIADAANRAVASFYPFYARGLAADQTPNGKPPAAVDNEEQDPASRIDAMRQLAGNTDGLVAMSSSAFDSMLARIAADMTAYDLVTYHSTNAKLDEKFRSISVRTVRPGVMIRTRRGYRGAGVQDVLGSETSTASVQNALGAIGVTSPRAAFRIRTATARTDAGADATLWVVGELDYRARREVAWTAGAVADVTVVGADGREVGSQMVDVSAADTSFTIRAPGGNGLQPGEYAVRVRLTPNNDGALAVTDTARVVVPKVAPVLGEGLLWRRGPSTGPRYVMTADPRFQRSDRIRVEMPTRATGPVTARMLDRLGKPNQIPVQVTERQDPGNDFRWIVADASLAALAPGDYAIETTLDGVSHVTAFQLVP